ncbi:MAG: hypothetical protein OSB41_14355, partial [Kiritimatiellae bacterium]|nr:hypothetical protein [Kiritimatiellia bacterium]
PSMSLLPGIYGARCHLSQGEMFERLARVDRLIDFCVLPDEGTVMKSNSSGYVLLEGQWAHGNV